MVFGLASTRTMIRARIIKQLPGEFFEITERTHC